MNAPSPTPWPQILCHVVGAHTLTVGQTTQVTCDATTLGDLSQKKIEFKSSDPNELRFLGAPTYASHALTQEFTSYKTGAHNITGAQIVMGDQTFLLSPLEFEVKSVLTQTAGTTPTPFPEIDPVSVPIPLWWWGIWILVFLLALGVGIWRFLVFRKKALAKSRIEKEIHLPPKEKFQLALRQLESKGLHLQGEYKTFAVELTFIIKKFMGSEFHFPAEDLTSEELLSTLERSHQAFYNTAGTSLASFLADLDRIKFAKVETTQDQCSSLLDKASRIGNAIFGSIQ